MVALVVGVAVLVAGLVWDHQRNAALVSDAKSRATPFTPADEPDPLVVGVIGDSFTAGSREGGNDGNGWASLVEGRLYTHERPVLLRTHAKGGVGYQTTVDDTTFASLVDDLTGTEDAVVIFGSVNDRPSAGLSDAVADVVSKVNTKSPQASVLVVGPAWTELRGTSEAREATEAIRAGSGDTTFVDASDWFEGRDDLIGGDEVHPTNEGHRYLADQIAPLVAKELGIDI